MAGDKRPATTTSAVMSFPQPPLKKSKEYLAAYTGYAFTAISAIAQEVASIELKLHQVKHTAKGPETKLIQEHEVLSFLQYVNPLTTLYDQILATQVYLELTGEAFWIVLKSGTKPQEMWLVRPDWMSIVPDKKEIIKHYIYNPGGVQSEKIIIPKENVIHFKDFNPLNPYRGKGSVQAAAMPLDVHTFAQEWNRNFFFNSAIPGLIFTTEKKLSEKVIKKFINQWQASYGGRAKSNKIAFLGSGLKVDKTTMGAKELDFTAQQKIMRDDILAVFRVPKTILGLTDQVNYANAFATTRAFMERVITPNMRKFVEVLNEFLLPMYGETNLFFDFVDPAPEDVELKLKRYANARKYTWMTPNEIRAEENLESVEGGDDLFAPLAGGIPTGDLAEDEVEEGDEKGLGAFFKGMVPKRKKVVKKKVKKVKPKKKPIKHMVRIPPKRMEVIKREKFEEELTKDLTKMIGEMLKSENDKKGKDKKKDDKVDFKGTDSLLNEAGKDAFWKRFIEVVTEREKEIEDKAVELFEEQEKWILDRLEEVKYWKKDVRKGKEASVLPSVEELTKIWTTTLVPIIRDIVIEQGNYVLDFLGTGAHLDTLTETAIEFLRVDSAEMVTGINETTRQQLRESLATGFEAGESVPQLRIRIQDVFKEATKNRAEMIARTETLRASNFASVEAYRQSEVVEAKEWLTERDERTCPFCEEMDGKVIDLDESYFEGGDSLTVNGSTLDISSLGVDEPPLHVRCRCTTIPVLIGQRARNLREKNLKDKLKKEKKARIKAEKKDTKPKPKAKPTDIS